MKMVAIAGLALSGLVGATGVHAQSSQTGGGTGTAEIKPPGPARVTTPGTAETNVVKPGGVDNGGPGSAGTEIRGGSGAESKSNNPGADANAGRPELAVPNTGGGGK